MLVVVKNVADPPDHREQMLQALQVLGVLLHALAQHRVCFVIVIVRGLGIFTLVQLSHHFGGASHRVIDTLQLWIVFAKFGGDLVAFGGELAALRAALLGECKAKFAPSRGADQLNGRRGLVEGHEILEQSLAAIENALNDIEGNAFDFAEFNRQVGDEPIGRAGRCVQGPLGAIALLLRNLFLFGGGVLGRGRPIALLLSHNGFLYRRSPLPCRGSAKQHEEADRGPGQRQRAALLPDLLRQQVFLRNAADRRREVGAELGKFAIAFGRAIPVGAHIDPLRLGFESSLEYRGQGRCFRPIKVVASGPPGQFAVSHRNQQRVGGLMFEPVRDLLCDPGRACRFRRRRAGSESAIR